MRRVWMLALIAVLAVSAVVAGSAGYLYLSGGEASGDVPESEIPEDVYTGPEDLNASDGNISRFDCFCGGGNADAYGNYSPRSYEDYDYELANSSDGPTEERYVNVYEPGEPPEWIPESEFSMENHSAGTYEVTRYPNAEPTEEQLNAAWELYNRSFEAAKESGWFKFENAISDGYSLEINQHWMNTKNSTIYDDNLNPNSPETLIYYEGSDGDMVLVGYMYLNQHHRGKREGNQVGGPLTIWHYHPADMGFAKRVVAGADGFKSTRGLFEHLNFDINENKSAEMIHVWFINHPEGPFGTSMSVEQESIKKPEKMSEEEFKRYAQNYSKRGN